MNNNDPSHRSVDLGLLLLRVAPALVLATWGWGKFHGLVHALNSSQPLDTWGFVRLVRKLGFPFPTFMTVCAALNESLIAVLLILGVVTRPAALFASIGMVGALYSSVLLHNELLRAALFALIFAASAFLGAGRYSIDHALWPRRAHLPGWLSDFGLLLLRIGSAIASIWLAFVSPVDWPLVVACVGGGLVGFGLLSRPVSAVLAIFWLCAMSAELLTGQTWNVHPIRAALFTIIYGALALTGPGEIII